MAKPMSPWSVILFLALLATSATAILIDIYSSHLPTPAVHVVNGIYWNPHFGTVKLQNGYAFYNNERVPFKLEQMKYGLTGFPEEPIGEFYTVRVSEELGPIPNPISFNQSGSREYFTILDYQRRKYRFDRITATELR